MIGMIRFMAVSPFVLSFHIEYRLYPVSVAENAHTARTFILFVPDAGEDGFRPADQRDVIVGFRPFDLQNAARGLDRDGPSGLSGKRAGD